MRTTCAIRDNDDSTPIHCWGGRANDFLHHIERDRSKNSKVPQYQQVSLGKDHICAVSKLENEEDSMPSASSLQCWLAGSDFDAHKVPVELEIVNSFQV